MVVQQSDENPPRSNTSRRNFLMQSAAAVGSVSLANTFESFVARAAVKKANPDYGSLRPVADETTGLKLLELPRGFRYRSFGWTNDRMTDGVKTPGSHDGMSVIDERDGLITLCRNHEITKASKPFTSAETSYETNAAGGCSLLTFNGTAGKWESAHGAISGTVKNCAGGATPWNTWLTCEESVSGPGYVENGKTYDFKKHHGWIFEVPATGEADPVPLKEMGRFVHEAVAIDPATGIVYETEDRTKSGFYRFIPKVNGQLAKGGKLQMAKIKGAKDLRRGSTMGQSYEVSWADIADPTGEQSGIFENGRYDEHAIFKQGKKQGCTTFARLEGCWYGNKLIYIVATSGGNAESGQVWSYDPKNETLKLVFESPSKDVLHKPDNIAVSPRGGLVLCEDGDVVPQRIFGMTAAGRLFPFAHNIMKLTGERNGIRGDFRKQEFAGATFSSDGRWLFANIQTPGVTFAITGPWEKGGL